MNITELDQYLNSYIISFLPVFDYYAYAETCQEFNYIYKEYNKSKEKLSPPVSQQIQSLDYLNWCMSHPGFKKFSSYAYSAIINADLNMLRYLWNKKFIFGESLWCAALYTRDFEILKFLKRKKIQLSDFAFEESIINKDIEIFTFMFSLLNKNDQMDYESFFTLSLRFDIPEILSLLVNHFQFLYYDSLLHAIKYGSLNCIKFMLKWVPLYSSWGFNHKTLEGYDATSGLACSYAAMNNQLKVLKYLRKKGYVWNENTSYYALNYKDTFFWCIKAGCPVNALVLQQGHELYPECGLESY